MTANFGEPLTDEQMEACAIMAMRTMLEDYSLATQQPFAECLADFASSSTYNALFDFPTRIWAEGPDYLRCLWEREKKAG